jgi:hypothetical protein
VLTSNASARNVASAADAEAAWAAASSCSACLRACPSTRAPCLERERERETKHKPSVYSESEKYWLQKRHAGKKYRHFGETGGK